MIKVVYSHRRLTENPVWVEVINISSSKQSSLQNISIPYHNSFIYRLLYWTTCYIFSVNYIYLSPVSVPVSCTTCDTTSLHMAGFFSAISCIYTGLCCLVRGSVPRHSTHTQLTGFKKMFNFKITKIAPTIVHLIKFIIHFKEVYHTDEI